MKYHTNLPCNDCICWPICQQNMWWNCSNKCKLLEKYIIKKFENITFKKYLDLTQYETTLTQLIKILGSGRYLL